MQSKMLKLLVTFIVLFSLRGFSQTTQKSAHPLLDKYYPQKQEDTSKILTTQTIPATETKPIIDPRPVPTVADRTPVSKPTNITAPVSATKPISATKPVPVLTDTTAVNESTNTTVTAPETKPIPETKSLPGMTDTTAINKPAKTTVLMPVPVQKQVQAKPAGPPYIDTRLGSSSPQYDTWEKNRNGAGSVTTSPK